MWFIGDCHGKIKQYRTLIRAMPEGAKSLQLGDMGVGFKGVHLMPVGSLLRGEHKFIRGNHDSPKACRGHKLYAGDFGYMPDEQLFFLGGAWSIDQNWRVEGVSWWRDEELSYAELDQAYQLYVKVRPRIVATHEAPSKAAWSMLSKISGGGWVTDEVTGLILPGSERDPSPTDQSVRVKGDEYEYYKQKLGCVNTRTSQALQRMFEEWQPEFWLHGHYHLTRDYEIGPTHFTCLNELDTREIELKEVSENKPDK